MNWDSRDNKGYAGPIDRVFVSATESYEIRFYIDQYLRVRGLWPTTRNRTRIARKLEDFPGRAPWKRVDLDRYLDKSLSK
jgi:hypothetical protein